MERSLLSEKSLKERHIVKKLQDGLSLFVCMNG